MSILYTLETESINISVKPQFLESESNPVEYEYIWLYHVAIENKGHNNIQLISREWRITDSNGLTQIVQGEGVIGVQPIIKPEKSFEYTSSVRLSTPSGVMYGKYIMQDHEMKNFNADIPFFSLDSTEQIARPN